MRKIFVIFQWVLVIGLVVFVAYSVFKPQPKPAYDPASWHSWGGFFAVSYSGTPRDFAEQLELLGEAGYSTIKVEDAAAFLEGRSPLPEKALVLLFEGGRKDTARRVTPRLRKLGLIGNMCVPTRQTESWELFSYLKKDDLEGLCKDPRWSLVSMGHDAGEEVALDAAGNKGHFLARRMWLGDRVESDAAFRKRIVEDYGKAAQILADVAGTAAVAYLYPFADSGQGAEADPLAAEVNRKAVAKYHRLAFTRVGDPFNGSGCDPYDLTRIRVPVAWDAERLIKELESFQPHALRTSLSGWGGEGLWQLAGDARLDGDFLLLGPGSAAWLRGSDDWVDTDVKATMRPASGATSAVYVRYGGPRSYVRLALDAGGVHLQERLGTTMQTLGRRPLGGPLDRDHHVRLRVKGNRVWAWHDETPVAAAVPLTGTPAGGRIGFETRNGSLRVSRLSASSSPRVFVLADGYAGLPPSLKENAGTVLPVWFPRGITSEVSPRHRADLLVAAAAGVRTVPVIRTPPDLSAEAATNMAARLGFAFRYLGMKTLVRSLAVEGDTRSLPDELRKLGYEVLLIVSPEQAMRLADRRESLEKTAILIDGPETEARPALERLSRIMPTNRLIMRAASPAEVPDGVRTAIRYESGSGRGL